LYLLRHRLSRYRLIYILYIVGPDDLRDKVFNELNRPTFARLKPPLPKICKFISYAVLKKELDQLGNRMSYMKPEFIDEIADSCEPDDLPPENQSRF